MHHIDLRVGKNAQRLTLTRQNRDRLGKRNAINICELPRTIMDAVTSVEMLGKRYLWVGALCIEPGHEIDLAAQIPIMGHIYTRSFLIVVAASGEDADSGLPVLNELSARGVQRVIGPLGGGDVLSICKPSCCSYCITARQNTTPYLARLTWDTRGWTFQEKELSRRLLIFAEEQAYWECTKRYLARRYASREFLLPLYNPQGPNGIR